jgi:hypothetical protein
MIPRKCSIIVSMNISIKELTRQFFPGSIKDYITGSNPARALAVIQNDNAF